MRSRLGSVLGTAAALSALVAGSAVLPAAAADPTTISLHVQDVSGEPIPGISVEAYGSEDGAFLGETNADGDIVRSSGVSGDRISSGSYDLYFTDEDPGRRAIGTAFAFSIKKLEVSGGTQNTYAPVILQAGATITGRATARSGRPLRNMTVLASFVDESEYQDVVQTSATGRFRLQGLAAGSYSLDAIPGGDNDEHGTGARARLAGPGATAKADIKGFAVQCEDSFKATTKGHGRVALTIRSTGEELGLLRPGGTMKIYRDGKKIRDFRWTGYKKSVTLDGQARGHQVSFTVVRSGGDCFRWSATSSVRVK